MKFGWLDPFKYSSLNAITKHGADAAGGVAELVKVKAKNALGM